MLNKCALKFANPLGIKCEYCLCINVTESLRKGFAISRKMAFQLSK